MTGLRLEAPGQQEGAAADLAAVVAQGLAAAGGIDCNGVQQLAQLPGAAGIEGAVGAVGEGGHLLEGTARLRLAALMEDEGRHADKSELARELAQLIDALFQLVA